MHPHPGDAREDLAITHPDEHTTLRRMTPADVPDVMRVHREGFPDSISSRVGDRYLGLFFDYFLTRPNCVALITVLDGRISGYVTGNEFYKSPATDPLIKLTAALGIATHPTVLLNKSLLNTLALYARYELRHLPGKFVKRLSKPKPAQDFAGNPDDHDFLGIGLTGIAVAPWARGKKQADYLMQGFDREARSLGARRFWLTVKADNLAARRLYEKHGWIGVPKENDAYLYTKDIPSTPENTVKQQP